MRSMLESLPPPPPPTIVKPKTKLSKFPDLAALRPRQWTKNLIVFAAPVFAFSLDWRSLSGSLLAFILLCAASSSFYLFNDIADVKSDRLHPIKCQRPIAAGQVKISIALVMAVVLLSTALIVGELRSPALGNTLIIYAALQITYNLKLSEPTKEVYESEQTERPEEILLTDLPMFLTVLGWVLTILTILWLQHQGVIE